MENPTPTPDAGLERQETSKRHHVCPWWMGYLHANPLRRLLENPHVIFAPHVQAGMTVLDIGCAMGFFNLPLAELVGPDGRVVCVDIQERMLASLRKRARKKRLDEIIETRRCSQDDLGLDDLTGQVDLALAWNVVHETSYPTRLLQKCYAVFRPGGRLMIAEPRGRVSAAEFETTRQQARDLQFEECEPPRLRRGHSALFEKPLAGRAESGAAEKPI